MLLKWVTSEEASCPTRSYLEHYDQQSEDSKKHINSHLARPHILISSLPNPAEPLEIPLPSMVKSKSGALNIQNIANLWTQLLSIQTQNGNFIRHEMWSRAKEGLKMCISQMTPDECANIYRSLKEADPPVEEAVADLICSLPYVSCNDECFKIAPCTMMPDPTSERALFLGGPVLPPHLMRLTDWWGGDSGILILVDVLSGEAIELKDYKPNWDEGDPCGQVMTEYNGPRTLVEDLLREWIDNCLSARWIPDASMDIISAEWRSMIFLKYKALFEEFNWPTAFPLPQTQFDTFLKRHKDLTRRDQSEDRPFSHVWYQLTEAWFKSDKARETPSAEPTSNYQYLHIIDNKIQEALKYEEARAIDMAYAAAVGGEIEERLKAPVRLHDSGNSGDGWSIDVKAEDIMERFWNVIALGPEIVDTEDDIWPAESASKKKTDVLEEIGKVMEAAYYRYLDPGEADREARMVGVPDEDDDSTSDYEEDDIGEDEDNDNSSDTMDGSENEDEDDLDVTALQTDMYLDVEAIREQLADSQVTVSETQASSQTLRGEESTQE